MGWAQAIAAVVGGIAGNEKDRAQQSTNQLSGVHLAPESELEKYGGQLTHDSLKSLQGMVNAGPGLESIGQANQQYESLASMLGDFSKSGGMPGQQDWLNAQEFAKQQFAPQQMAMNHAFEDEQIRVNQLAAQMGRPVNDAYFQTQMAKEKFRAQNMMGAEMGAFMGQEARNGAMQRLGYTSQLADLRGSLASQAMANRQALLSLGSGVQQQERNWRYNISNKFGLSTTQQESGGGFKGMLAGGMAMASAVGGMGGGDTKDTGGLKATGGATAQEIPRSQVPMGGAAVMVPQTIPMSIPQYQQAPAMPQRGSRINAPRGGYGFGGLRQGSY